MSTRKPAFWVVFALVSLACAVFAWRFFPHAFPLVSLDIAMSREAAIAKAQELAAEHGWGPRGNVRTAASFGVDEETQTFVELEAGGKEAFSRLLTEGRYAPYSWSVRLFREGETNETLVRFTPEGKPFGFEEHIPEEAPGAALDPGSARAIAERDATSRWAVDLGEFALVESAQETRPGGRIDHTFTYERQGATLGEGRYRLRLGVSGDRLTDFTHFVKIPQAFSRRYEEMRSANTAIGVGGLVGAGVLYLALGCGVGIFLLMRRRAIRWRPAVVFALLIAGAQALAGLNSWPLAWMDYDTALPAATFTVQTLLAIAAGSLSMGAVLAATFMAAEGLSRLAFPDHPQFWHLWNRKAAPSPEIAGRTLAGYLWVPLDLAYVMVLYWVAGRWWGWWSPSDALLSPDSLATLVPWFTPFANALQAGVWEECLFRAVPIAGAALLGDRFGKRGLFIALAFVVQAAIFGAGHAPYPAQPSYARPVELILPSFIFGYLYLRYGLLPAIVLHFVFDIVLMSLPIFAATGGGLWFDKTMLVLLTLGPALVVLVRRVQAGAWSPLPPSLLNAGWTPPPVVQGEAEAPADAPQPALVPRAALGLLALVAAVSVPWAIMSAAQAKPDVPGLSVGRGAAIETARQALEARGVTLPKGWRSLVSVVGAPGDPDRLVWSTAGRDVYERVLGTWIEPPRFRVRFARFEGDVAERAEEWAVSVDGTGRVRGVRHRLPEDRSGASLDETAARALAHEAIRRELGLDPATLKEVSAVPSKLKARTDWGFTFTDQQAQKLPQGERRVRVDLAGDEKVGVARFVHVPEEWERKQRSLDATLGIAGVARAIAVAAILISAAVMAVIAWSRHRFAARPFALVLLVLVLVGVASVANTWPLASAQFSTAQPWPVQALIALLGGGIVQFAIALVGALVAALGIGRARGRAAAPASQSVLAGLLAGLVVVGVSGIARSLIGTASPPWPQVMAAGTLMPMVAGLLNSVTAYALSTALVLFLYTSFSSWTRGFTTRKAPAVASLLVLGALVGGATTGGSVAAWAASAAVSALLLAGVFLMAARHDLSVVAVATAVVTMGQATDVALSAPYPGASVGGVLAIAAVAVLAWWWWNTMRQGPPAANQASAASV